MNMSKNNTVCSKLFVYIIHVSSQNSACTKAEPEKPQQTSLRNI